MDCYFRRQCNEKPGIVLGCPDTLLDMYNHVVDIVDVFVTCERAVTV